MSRATLTDSEAELLVLCARQTLGNDLTNRAKNLLREPLHWPALLENAWRHGVASLLFKHLQLLNQEVNSVPPAAMHQLRQAYVRATFRNRSHFAAIAQVLTRFADARIPVILLKGAALAPRIYQDAALRPFADIDLMVRSNDIDHAKQMLASLGFAISPDLLSESFNRKYHINLPFVRQTPAPVHIEMHWDLTDPFSPVRFQPDEMFSASQRIELLGTSAQILGPEDEAAYLAAHLDNHGYLNRSVVEEQGRRYFALHHLSGNRLIWLTDLHELLERPLDWKRVLQRADGAGARGALAVSLRLLGELFGTAIDPALLRELPLRRQPWPKQKLANYVFSLAETAPASRMEKFGRRFLVTRKSFELRLVRLIDLWPHAFGSGRSGAGRLSRRRAFWRCSLMLLEFLWRRLLRGRRIRQPA